MNRIGSTEYWDGRIPAILNGPGEFLKYTSGVTTPSQMLFLSYVMQKATEQKKNVAFFQPAREGEWVLGFHAFGKPPTHYAVIGNPDAHMNCDIMVTSDVNEVYKKYAYEHHKDFTQSMDGQKCQNCNKRIRVDDY